MPPLTEIINALRERDIGGNIADVIGTLPVLGSELYNPEDFRRGARLFRDQPLETASRVPSAVMQGLREDPITMLAPATGPIGKVLSSALGLAGAGTRGVLPAISRVARSPAGVGTALVALDAARRAQPQATEALESTPPGTVDYRGIKAAISSELRRQIQSSIGSARGGKSGAVITARGGEISVDPGASRAKDVSKLLPPIAGYEGYRKSIKDPKAFADYTKALNEISKRTNELVELLPPKEVADAIGIQGQPTFAQKRSYARSLAMQDLPAEYQALIRETGIGSRPQEEAILRKLLTSGRDSALAEAEEDRKSGVGGVVTLGAAGAGLLALALLKRGKAKQAKKILEEAARTGGSAATAAAAESEAIRGIAGEARRGLPAGGLTMKGEGSSMVKESLIKLRERAREKTGADLKATAEAIRGEEALSKIFSRRRGIPQITPELSRYGSGNRAIEVFDEAGNLIEIIPRK